MKILSVSVDGYGSLKSLSFEPQSFSVLIGANGQGKSLIFESLNRFFADFNSIGGGATAAVSDSLWFRREPDSPITFELDLALEKEERSIYLPVAPSFLDRIDPKFKTNLDRLKLRRSLSAQGTWKTELIQWGEIPLVSNDVTISPDKIAQYTISEPLKDFCMYFFTAGNSKDNIGGDRLIVDSRNKKAFNSIPQFDDLVKRGVIETSVEFAGQNAQQWAGQKGLTMSQPTPDDLAAMGVLPPERIQQLITSLSQIRGKFKMIPAARDVKTGPGQRMSLLEPSVVQNMTSMSIDRRRSVEKKWEQFRGHIQTLLRRRLEANPTQVLLKEGDLGLQPSEIGGGEQSIMGLVLETIDANTILAIEEPENHLHPKLQRLLLSYFMQLAEKTQIIITTHSPIFASKLDVAGVFLVAKDEEGRTAVERVNEGNVNRVIDELGIKPADMFDYDNVVFVEGQDDVKIYSSWAGRLIRTTDTRVGFIDSEGWNSMEYYANARILKSRKVGVVPYVIFDGDTEKDDKRRAIKDRLVKQLSLSEDHILTLRENSIEGYLLVPSAIRRAFPQLDLSEEEMTAFLEKQTGKSNRKAVLDQLLRRGGQQGGYDGEIGAQIAQVMREDEIEIEIKEIFGKITKSSSLESTFPRSEKSKGIAK